MLEGVVPGSFRDPCGLVFVREGVPFRRVHPAQRAKWELKVRPAQRARRELKVRPAQRASVGRRANVDSKASADCKAPQAPWAPRERLEF